MKSVFLKIYSFQMIHVTVATLIICCIVASLYLQNHVFTVIINIIGEIISMLDQGTKFNVKLQEYFIKSGQDMTSNLVLKLNFTKMQNNLSLYLI